MALIFPFISFLIGYFAVERLRPYRPVLAMILAKFLILFIIIYNMVFYQEGSIWLMLFSFSSSFLMYVVFSKIYQDRLKALCLSYLNMAWLGFPFALAVFGPDATNPMVALYIGGSIFGNICAVIALSQKAQSIQQIISKVGLSPPVMALIISGLLSFFDLSQYQNHAWIQLFYQIDKVLMTFSGMCILGMWLSQVRIHWQDLISGFKSAGLKVVFGSVLCILAYMSLPIPHETTVFAVMLMFFMLPPAANIVALETHYQGSGESAQYIASGTVVSVIVIAIYAVLIHLFNR